MASTSNATELVTLIRKAIDSLGALANFSSPLPGLNAFQGRVEREISWLERTSSQLSVRGRLEVRGVAAGGTKSEKSRRMGTLYGGRPPRIAMLEVLSNDPESTTRLRMMPARVLLYALQRAGSVGAAVQWLKAPQAEFGGEIPSLYIDRRLLRKYTAWLKLQPRMP
jgi:hypothetical protein